MKCLVALFFLLSLFLTGCEPIKFLTSPAQERGMQGAWGDQSIRFRLNLSWLEEGGKAVSPIEFLIYQGQVMLMGIAKTYEAKDLALSLAKRTKGVEKVIDEIQVDSVHERSGIQDSWLTCKLQALLFGDGRIFSQNYHVKVVDKIVYIIGTAQHSKELAYVLEHAENFPIRRIIHYVKIP